MGGLERSTACKGYHKQKVERGLHKFSFWTNVLIYLLFPARQPAALLFNSTEAQRGYVSCQVSTPGRHTAVEIRIFFKSGITWHSTIAPRLCLREMTGAGLSRSLSFLKKKNIKNHPHHFKEVTRPQIFS